jgi:hypothetical protein
MPTHTIRTQTDPASVVSQQLPHPVSLQSGDSSQLSKPRLSPKWTLLIVPRAVDRKFQQIKQQGLVDRGQGVLPVVYSASLAVQAMNSSNQSDDRCALAISSCYRIRTATRRAMGEMAISKGGWCRAPGLL